MNFSGRKECNQPRRGSRRHSHGGDRRGGREAATEAEAGTMRASEGIKVVGTEVALVLAGWTPGFTADRTVGRGHVSLAWRNSFSPTLHVTSLLSNPQTPDHPGFFVSDYIIVTTFLVPIKNHCFS